MKERVSLADVARTAGISKMTVSLALRGVGRVAPDTRKRVLDLAREMGYRPHATLSVLAANRWKARRFLGEHVAHVVPQFPQSGYESLHLEGMRKRGEALGYRVDPFVLKAPGDLAKAFEKMRRRGIRGVVLLNVREAFDEEVLAKSFAMVRSGSTAAVPRLHTVLADQASMARRVWKFVLARAPRRVAVMLDPEDAMSLEDWHERLLRAAVRDGAEEARRAGIRVDYSPYPSHALVPRDTWLWRGRYDLIVGRSAGELFPAIAMGLPLGESCDFVCLSTTFAKVPGTRWIMTGPYLAPTAVGEAAMDMLDSQLRLGRFGVPEHRRTVMVEPEWVWGNTTRSQLGV